MVNCKFFKTDNTTSTWGIIADKTTRAVPSEFSQLIIIQFFVVNPIMSDQPILCRLGL